ncbi:hypothetical protein ID866_4887 [Astraeus odoratus]|nr:hypothetical protein ID866_4887 [Astraeus odoratus]
MVNADPLWQNALYFGNALSNILYGVELTLWFSTITVFLATIFVSTQVIFGEQMWIIHYDYPGGMGKYYTDHSSVWYQTLGHGAMVALQLSSDGLLISRFFTVSETTLLTKWILVLPCILWTATLGGQILFICGTSLKLKVYQASGLLLCFYCGVWHSNVFAGNAADIAMAYYALAIALNVLITLIFCGRIVTVGSSAGGKFGSDLSRKFYSAVASIIQFVLLRTTIGLVFLVTFALGSGVSAGFLSLYVMISVKDVTLQVPSTFD